MKRTMHDKPGEDSWINLVDVFLVPGSDTQDTGSNSKRKNSSAAKARTFCFTELGTEVK